MKIPFSLNRKLILSRKRKQTRVVCEIDEDIKICKNIFEIPDIYLNKTHFDKNLENSSYVFCSEKNICEKTNLNLEKFYYMKNVKDGKIKDNWNVNYSIPSRLNKNLFVYPISFKFKSNIEMIKYFQMECKKRSMIYAIENPFKNILFFWQTSFLYKQIFIKYCNIQENNDVKCFTKYSLVSFGDYFPLRIECKNVKESRVNLQISRVPSRFYLVLFFFSKKTLKTFLKFLS